MQDLFEPELVGLMDDDEQHLVVSVQLSFDQAKGRLEREKLVDREITPIVGGLLAGLKWAIHCQTVAYRADGSQSPPSTQEFRRLPSRTPEAKVFVDRRTGWKNSA